MLSAPSPRPLRQAGTADQQHMDDADRAGMLILEANGTAHSMPRCRPG